MLASPLHVHSSSVHYLERVLYTDEMWTFIRGIYWQLLYYKLISTGYITVILVSIKSATI